MQSHLLDDPSPNGAEVFLERCRSAGPSIPPTLDAATRSSVNRTAV